jgi:hypothetical protein
MLNIKFNISRRTFKKKKKLLKIIFFIITINYSKYFDNGQEVQLLSF